MHIANVIFDLDGTLLDTSKGILESIAYAADCLGYPELPEETLRKFIGPPIQQSFVSYYGADEETAQKAADVFRDYYKSTALYGAVPYEGIYALCKALQARGVRMAVATYKREDYAVKLLQHFQFDEYCNPMHGGDNNNTLKKEDIVRSCLREMHGTIQNTILVGDTYHDALGAEKLSLPFVAALYGFGFKTNEDVEKYPHFGVIRTPEELLTALDK